MGIEGKQAFQQLVPVCLGVNLQQYGRSVRYRCRSKAVAVFDAEAELPRRGNAKISEPLLGLYCVVTMVTIFRVLPRASLTLRQRLNIANILVRTHEQHMFRIAQKLPDGSDLRWFLRGAIRFIARQNWVSTPSRNIVASAVRRGQRTI